MEHNNIQKNNLKNHMSAMASQRQLDYLFIIFSKLTTPKTWKLPITGHTLT